MQALSNLCGLVNQALVMFADTHKGPVTPNKDKPLRYRPPLKVIYQHPLVVPSFFGV